MPPKASGKDKKAEAAKKAKAIEDKTFGLKNKNKSKAVQQYVETLQRSGDQSGQAKRLALADPNSKEAKAKKKEEEERHKRELAEIFVPVVTQAKVPVGVDPKSIVCEFFRKGSCLKGFKCKFSHDLAVERKAPKIDLYSDRRDGGTGGGGDTMEDWDQAKLEAAVAEKHGKDNVNRPTEIVCKHFLDAIEKKQYGWFWGCPGGADCKYRHALPPGYVLQSQIKALAAEAAASKRTVEEEIEEQRACIKASTPVTEAVFAAWKRRKVAAAAAARDAARDDRVKAGRLSGRELTELGGFTFEDDEEAQDGAGLAREDDVEAAFASAAAAARAAAAAAAARRAAREAVDAAVAGLGGLEVGSDEEGGEGGGEGEGGGCGASAGEGSGGDGEGAAEAEGGDEGDEGSEDG